MTTATIATGTSTDFGVTDFKANAVQYAEHKRLVEAAAASKYDSIDDAVAALLRVRDAVADQVDRGLGYTPAPDMGFGSRNASEIGATILGIGKSDKDIKKTFSELGK